VVLHKAGYFFEQNQIPPHQAYEQRGFVFRAVPQRVSFILSSGGSQELPKVPFKGFEQRDSLIGPYGRILERRQSFFQTFNFLLQGAVQPFVAQLR